MMIDPIAVFVLLLGAATPILFAALGELVVERAGVLNLGVEGMMIGGALAGFAAAHATGSPAIGFLAAAIAGLMLGLLFALLTQFLLSNQVATGLALTLFGLGLTALFGKPYEGVKAPSMGAGILGLN
ncbi:MAG: ABC transporter permease subunit, partial [Paracoccus sp. (in: a-proteobacteria)]